MVLLLQGGDNLADGLQNRCANRFGFLTAVVAKGRRRSGPGSVGRSAGLGRQVILSSPSLINCLV